MSVVVVTALILLALVLIGLLTFARSQKQIVTDLDELAGRTRAVDMLALQNLVDSAETRFLRQKLDPAQFRIVQRERTLAAAEYVRAITHNAAILVQLGQAGRLSPNPQLAEAARVIVERAAHVRIIGTVVLLKLYANSLIPALPFAADQVFRDYRNLTESAVLFARLQRPVFAGRVGAML